MHIETRMAQLGSEVNANVSTAPIARSEKGSSATGVTRAQEPQEVGWTHDFRAVVDDDTDDLEDLEDAQLPILVVDDDLAMQEALKDVLEQLGYNTVGACHGAEALELLRQGCQPLLVLLDLGMPTMDGWEFREELLRDPRFVGLPVVVITATHDLRAEELSVTDVLTKPVQLARLVDILESQVGPARFQ